MSAAQPGQPSSPRPPRWPWLAARREMFPYSLAVFAAILIMWEMATRLGGISRIILPSPSAIIVNLVAHRGLFLVQALRSLEEIVVGFAASVAFAMPLAILLSVSRLLERTFYPLIVGFQTVPVVSIAPIMLAMFGFGLLPKVIVVVLISFFPIMVNTFTGMKATSELIDNLARSMGASRWQFLWHFQLPGALPSTFAGMKVAITLAVIGAIVAEFVGSDSGLGYEIMVAGSDLDLAHQFASVAVLTGLGLCLFSLMVWVERLCLPWHVSMRPSRRG